MKEKSYIDNTFYYNNYNNLENLHIEVKHIESEKEIDFEKLYILCDKCFENMKSFKNIEQVVSYIRTIFRDLNELFLFINYCGSEKRVSLRFENKKLVYFSSHDIIDDNLYLFTEYTEDTINYKIVDKTKKVNLLDDGQFDSIFSENLKNIRSLSQVTQKIFGDDAQALYKIYKLFYKECPDFSAKDIHLKVQTMLSILSHFGISLGEEYYFTNLSKTESKEPFSANLTFLIEDIKPFGKIDNLVDSVKLSDNAKKVIELVSENIHSYVTDERSLEDVLVSISTLLHVQCFNLSSGATLETISNFVNRNIDDVEKDIKLIFKINKNLRNEF